MDGDRPRVLAASRCGRPHRAPDRSGHRDAEVAARRGDLRPGLRRRRQDRLCRLLPRAGPAHEGRRSRARRQHPPRRPCRRSEGGRRVRRGHPFVQRRRARRPAGHRCPPAHRRRRHRHPEGCDFMSVIIDEALQGQSLESVQIDESYRDPDPLPHDHKDSHWIRRMVPVVRPHLTMIIIGILAAVVSMVLRVEVPHVVGAAIDHAIKRHDQPLGHYVRELALMGAGILGFGFIFRYFTQRAAYEMEYTLRVLMFRQFSKLSFSFYDRVQTGQLISRANSDVRSVQMFLMWGPMMAVSLVSFAVALFFMLTINVPLTFVSLIGLPFVFMASRKMHRWMFPVSWVVSARQADIATIVEENVGGAQVVRSFAAEK